MKKFIALLIAMCLAFAVFTGCNQSAAGDTAAPAADEADVQPAEDAAADAADASEADAAAAAVETKSVDFAAIYALHQPDEVVAAVDGRDVTWAEYFYWLYVQGSQIDNYIQQMAAYYGLQISWDDTLEDGSDETYADTALSNAESMLCQVYGIEGYAKANKVELTDADKETIKTQLESDIKAVCGDDGTEEQFNEKIAETYLPRELYDRICAVDALYNDGFNEKYGENGEKVTDEDAVKYLEDNGYLSANHILLMTIDPDTREALTDEQIAEKKATAEKIAAELKAIKDPEELVKRFAELKAEYCEDTGKETYPDGYVFTEGKMVAEFEDTVKALSAHEVSDPVESQYGFHVIMRLPSDADRTVSYSSDGKALSARYLAASDAYQTDISAYIDTLSCDFVSGFEKPVITDYLK